MSITKKITVAAALVGLVASSAFADSAGAAADTAGKMVFKARAGYMNTNLKHNYAAADGGNYVSLKNGYVGEVAMGYFFNDNIATEVSLGFGRAKITDNANKKKHLKVVPLTALVQYHIMPEASFSPYVGAGYSYQFVSGVTNVKDAGAAVVQLGTDIAFNDTMGFNIDLKHTFKADHKVKNTTYKYKVATTTVMAGVTFPF